MQRANLALTEEIVWISRKFLPISLGQNLRKILDGTTALVRLFPNVGVWSRRRKFTDNFAGRMPIKNKSFALFLFLSRFPQRWQPANSCARREKFLVRMMLKTLLTTFLSFYESISLRHKVFCRLRAAENGRIAIPGRPQADSDDSVTGRATKDRNR